MARLRYLSSASLMGEPIRFGVWLHGTGIGGHGEYLGNIEYDMRSMDHRVWRADGNLVKHFPAAARHAPSPEAMKRRLRNALRRRDAT